MEHAIFPGYENHVLSYATDGSEETLERKKRQGKAMMSYTLPEGMTMEDRRIPGYEDGQEITIRIFTPQGLPEKAPMILDIHGGGFVGGNLDIDNGRCIAIASRVPAIVVSVEYRLSGKNGVHFPKPLYDCHAAYMYLHEHAEEFGGDSERLGLHGSSAGGTLAGGLALYLRDRNDIQPKLTVLNCPCILPNIEATTAFYQNVELKMSPTNKAECAEAIYLGGYDGTRPSYYAFPGFAYDVAGLGPTMIIAAEKDTLRDAAVEYATRLLQAQVPTELHVAPRVAHCFTAAPHPYTDFYHDMMAWSFKREFGLLDDLKLD